MNAKSHTRWTYDSKLQAFLQSLMQKHRKDILELQHKVSCGCKNVY